MGVIYRFPFCFICLLKAHAIIVLGSIEKYCRGVNCRTSGKFMDKIAYA
jgi:hypothetical protein